MSRLTRAAALLAVLIAGAAQAQFVSSPVRQPPRAASGAAPGSYSYETIGYNAGAGTAITSANAAKYNWYSVGAFSQECSAVTLHLIGVSAQRFLIDVQANGVFIVKDLPLPNTVHTQDVTLNLNVQAGAAIQMRAQASATSLAVYVSLTCRQRRAGEFPGYAIFENLSPDLSQTRAGTAELTFNNAWTTIAVTAADYAGFLVMSTQSSVAGTTQNFGWEFGAIDNGSPVSLNSGTATSQSGNIRMPIYVNTMTGRPSGTTLVARAAGTNTTDTIRFGVMGYR